MSTRPERLTPFSFTNSCAPTPPGLTPRAFVEELKRVPRGEQLGVIRTWMQDRHPAAFSSCPYLWESAREWLARRSGVSPHEIGLAGSAQFGFSTSPKKAFAPFDKESSDLDIFVVSPALFVKVESEARIFVTRQLTASKTDYLDQAQTTDRTLQRGYVDLYHVPANHDRYPTIASLKNDMSILIDKLKLSSFRLKSSHIRVYRDWKAKAAWTTVQAEAWSKLASIE